LLSLIVRCYEAFDVTPISLNQKRVLAGVYLVALIFCASNYYLGWHLMGRFDKGILAITTLMGAICAHRYGPALIEELREYRAGKPRRS
jgi:hypothetical protein